jgi:hypothetical protein
MQFDFSKVRVHTDNEADKMNQDLRARAFTHGQDIYFGASQYNTQSIEGKRLIAHELAHVLQQSPSLQRTIGNRAVGRLLRAYGARNTVQRRILVNSPGPQHQLSADERNRLLRPGRSSQRDVQIISRNYQLAHRIVADMEATRDDLVFSDMYQLRSELIKRLTYSVAMTATQQGGREWPAFGYPRRGKVCSYGPRVNFAAKEYWTPRVPDIGDANGYGQRLPDPCSRRDQRNPRHPEPGDPPNSGYEFQLTPRGRADGYQALMSLFVPQSRARRRNRTLIHCDHLASLLHYRSFAAALGEQEFNRRVRTLRDPQNPAAGYIIPLNLRWDGFIDIGRRAQQRESMHLYRTEPSTEVRRRDDLVIGDHVVFFNHILYDFLMDIAGQRGDWRLENAILVDRRGNNDLFQGHGTPRLTELGMKRELSREFNTIVSAALDELRANFAAKQSQFPGVLHRVGNRYFIRGIELPAQTNWQIRQIGNNAADLAEIPGLYNPRSFDIVGGRPTYSPGTRQLWPVWRPIESRANY